MIGQLVPNWPCRIKSFLLYPLPTHQTVVEMLASTLRTRALGAMRRPAMARSFVAGRMLRNDGGQLTKEQREKTGTAYKLEDITGPESLVSPGAPEGEVPNDFDQATGLERLELLGLMAGTKVFDRAPLDSSRKGTMEHPIIVDSYEKYRYVGCTGSPAGSHQVLWLRPREGKVDRCWECGSVYKVNYLGIEGDDHHH
jgi:cytochrome c oxidase subunit 5b